MSFFESLGKAPTLVEQGIRDLARSERYHEFSYPSFLAYKIEGIGISKMTLIPDGVRVNHRGQRFFFWKTPNTATADNLLSLGSILFSKEKIEGIDGAEKRSELEYTFEAIFSRDSYPNAKKFYNRVTYPSRLLKREGIELKELDSSYEAQALALHETWLQGKYADIVVHRHSLSTARYRKSTHLAFLRPDVFKVYGAIQGSDLLSVRVIGFEGTKCFDIAFYSDNSKLPSQGTEYLNVEFMRRMRDSGFETLNAGFTGERPLKEFKQHFPWEMITYYQYRRDV